MFRLYYAFFNIVLIYIKDNVNEFYTKFKWRAH